MRRTLVLAALETAQGILGSLAYGLDTIKRDIQRQARQQDRARKMAESVHRDLERIDTTG